MSQAANFGAPRDGPATPAETFPRIDDSLKQLLSTSSAATAPASPEAGAMWADTAVSGLITLKLYDGADWIACGSVDTAANTFTPASIATKAQMEAASSLSLLAAVGRMHMHPAIPKAIVRLTTLNTTPTITPLYNALGALSATRIGTGAHRLSWTNSLTNPNAMVIVENDTQWRISQPTVMTPTVHSWFTGNNGFVAVDPTAVTVVIWGNLP